MPDAIIPPLDGPFSRTAVAKFGDEQQRRRDLYVKSAAEVERLVVVLLRKIASSDSCTGESDAKSIPNQHASSSLHVEGRNVLVELFQGTPPSFLIK